MTNPPNVDFEFGPLGEADNYRRALIGSFSPALSGNVLEIGSGIGQMTRELKAIPAVKKLLAVEPDGAFVPSLRKAVPGVEVLQGTAADVKDRDWDAIVSVNVLEHIEEDAKELRMYHALLKAKKGALLLYVPARPELYAPIDKHFGHYRRYVKADLVRITTAAGFKIRSARYYDIIGYAAWWLNFCLLKRMAFDPKAVRFFDRFVFPWSHALESRISGGLFVGKNLLVIAEAV